MLTTADKLNLYVLHDIKSNSLPRVSSNIPVNMPAFKADIMNPCALIVLLLSRTSFRGRPMFRKFNIGLGSEDMRWDGGGEVKRMSGGGV